MLARRASTFIWAAVALCALVAGGLWLRQVPWQADFSKWPPASVYRMVLGQAPPRGVWGIRAAGRHFFTKRWVWMRFHASDAAIHAIAAQGTRLDRPQARQLLGQRWSARDRYDEADQRRVGWPGATALSGLPTFEFYTGSSSTWQWHGVIVWDRGSHMAYVKAAGD